MAANNGKCALPYVHSKPLSIGVWSNKLKFANMETQNLINDTDPCPKCGREYDEPYDTRCEKCGGDVDEERYTDDMVGEPTDDDLMMGG